MAKNVDLVYDRLVAGNKIKSSDKYEQLAAIVFYMLDQRTTVHDMRLLGSSGVRHQIDAVVGAGSKRSRILIECKDYNKKIGLPLVRNFWGAVDDIQPEEAFIVTTVGYTRPAIKFAAAKRIRLAVLRPPETDEDWGNVVKQINFELRATVPVKEPTINWFLPEDQAAVIAASPGGGHASVDDMTIEYADGLRAGTLIARATFGRTDPWGAWRHDWRGQVRRSGAA